MSVAVAHVMRTYGVHGGEHQLAQLFRSFEAPEFHHLFFFVYQDDVCQRYFSSISKLRTELRQLETNESQSICGDFLYQ